jgi:hypothetical protein
VTEADYFAALKALLDNRLLRHSNVKNDYKQSCYVINEPTQTPLYIDPAHLPTHMSFSLESRAGANWTFFKTPHTHAQKSCDLILVAWDRVQNAPSYLLLELKSNTTAGAWTQLQASLAFCRFVHGMIGVNQVGFQVAKYGAVTISHLPFAQKLTSQSARFNWEKRPQQSDCKHLQYQRSASTLPVAALLRAL